MKMRSTLRLSFGFLLVLASQHAFPQGVYWESTITGQTMDKPRSDRYSYMPKMLKTVNNEDGQIAIIRLDKETFSMTDPKEKTYWELTFAEMEEFMKDAGAAMDAQMAEMQKQLESLPEEQRKMVEKMMGGKMGSMSQKFEVINTGEQATISGFSCTKYEVTRGGDEPVIVWATKDVKEFAVIRKDMEEFGKRMEAMMPPSMKGMQSSLSGIDGFVVQTEKEGGWKSVVTKVEARSTPASEFEVPAGYKKVAAPMK